MTTRIKFYANYTESIYDVERSQFHVLYDALRLLENCAELNKEQQQQQQKQLTDYLWP